MSRLIWDAVGERTYETGVDHGVLYIPNSLGQYNQGFSWNGLTSISESPSGAEASPVYADNIKYLNLVSVEEFGATIEAFTYPDEFGLCDGTAEPISGLRVAQQIRKTFGLSYRTLLGNDVAGSDHGYKLHLVYGCLAAPSEKAYATVNESPEAITFSWEVSTTPVEVPNLKPSAAVTLDSTKFTPAQMLAVENILYGSEGVDPRLPLPSELIEIMGGSGGATVVVPVPPTFVSGTNTITIPTVTGLEYKVGTEVVAGAVVITENTLVKAFPLTGYVLPEVSDNDWLFTYNAG